MSDHISFNFTPDHREPALPYNYTGLCPACQQRVRSSEYDGYCYRCSKPQQYAGECGEWAAWSGRVVALNISDTTWPLELIYSAARRAASYGLEVLGRERVAA